MWLGSPQVSTAAGGDQSDRQLSSWVLDANVGYGLLVGISDINSSERRNIGAPSFGLEVAHQFGGGHRLGLRGDLMIQRGGPEAYHEVMARQAGVFYGWSVALGSVRLTAAGGFGMGHNPVSQSDVSARTVLHPRLFASVGASWQPFSFLGVGLDVVASGVGRTTVAGVGSLEISLP